MTNLHVGGCSEVQSSALFSSSCITVPVAVNDTTGTTLLGGKHWKIVLDSFPSGLSQYRAKLKQQNCIDFKWPGKFFESKGLGEKKIKS